MEDTQELVKSKIAISFIPYPGTLALLPPSSIFPSSEIIMNRDQYLKHIDDKAQEAATGELVVGAVGDDVTFVKIGDVVSLQNHSRIQKLIIDSGTFEKPNVFWIVRESEVLCKHDKKFK
tara:strand:- start:285 stop:644 length:360 start_codon:yes stop_codon:yes gene_type:complete